MTPKERIHAAIKGEPADRVAVAPIFMAWAAHFIGKTYRDYYLDGNVLVEAQLAVARAFNIDQLSVISDPWREAESYGMQFDYPSEGVGVPRGHLLNSAADCAAMRPLEVAFAPRMQQRVESVKKLSEAAGATHSVLGWVEGPLAEYADLRGVEQAMVDLIDQPELFLQTAEVLLETALRFAHAQVRAGADTIGVGDAAASLIGPDLYRQLILPLHKRLFAAIHQAGAFVKLHICGNTRNIMAMLAESGADIIDVDWMVPLEFARRQAGDRVCLCGNFDPAGVLLRGTVEEVRRAAAECVAAGGGKFILMPGCEVPPGTSEANLRAFCPTGDSRG